MHKAPVALVSRHQPAWQAPSMGMVSLVLQDPLLFPLWLPLYTSSSTADNVKGAALDCIDC